MHTSLKGMVLRVFMLVQVRKNRYVILPKDFERGYKANVKKSGDEFAFYQ